MTTPRLLDKVPATGIFQHKVFGLSVDREIMFSNHKSKYKPRIAKRQQKLVAKISFIRHFLKPAEEILLVTSGHSPPTILEKLGIGWLFLYLKRSLLIFTDRRIFHVPTTANYRYRNSIAQIPYASCESIQMKGSSLVVRYKGSGETEKFISLSGREKKKIRELLKIITFESAQSSVSRRVFLCPQCAATLYVSAPKCRQCGLRFRAGFAATVLAILLPGGGYFYLRQPFLGTITAFLESCAVFLIGTSVSDHLNGIPPNLPWLGGGILMLCLLKAFAVVHARVIAGEFIPRSPNISFQTVAAADG